MKEELLKYEYNQEDLDRLVSREVTVAVSTLGHVRDGFHTQMSVQGELQKYLPNTDQYRVVVWKDPNAPSNDDQTFVYFTSEDVYLINPFVSTGVVIFVWIDTGRLE